MLDSDFAVEWCEAWNAHDIERVLAHFHEDVAFTSPVAARLQPGTRGRLTGKAALRQYWTAALEQIPNLHFTIDRVYIGIDLMVIQYRNQNGVGVSEVLEIDGGKVIRGHGTYPVDVENPAGLSVG